MRCKHMYTVHTKQFGFCLHDKKLQEPNPGRKLGGVEAMKSIAAKISQSSLRQLQPPDAWNTLAAKTGADQWKQVHAEIGILFFIASEQNAGQWDFISYWAAGQQLVHGANPYDGAAIQALEHGQNG